MSLSPDGKWVLAAAGEAGKPRGLILLPTGAGQSRPLPGGQFVDYGGAAFFPDGKRIVFAAQKREGPWRTLRPEPRERRSHVRSVPRDFELRSGSRSCRRMDT